MKIISFILILLVQIWGQANFNDPKDTLKWSQVDDLLGKVIKTYNSEPEILRLWKEYTEYCDTASYVKEYFLVIKKDIYEKIKTFKGNDFQDNDIEYILIKIPADKETVILSSPKFRYELEVMQTNTLNARNYYVEPNPTFEGFIKYLRGKYEP